MNSEQKIIRNLVAPIKKSDYKNIDYYINPLTGIFMPASCPCIYSITKNHVHPSFSFFMAYDNFCKLAIDGREVQPVPGKLYILSPYIRHHEIINGDFSRYIAVFIDNEFFSNVFAEYSTELPVFRGDS